MPLRLRTFGSVYLTRDGESLSGAAGQRRLLAILAMVAAAGEQGLSRDKVLALLWSEGEPDKSRHALTQSLYHIRKALGVERIFLSGADLKLDPAFITSDVGDFQQALRESRLDDAVRYYGGPFVDGFYLNGDPEFDFWVSSARARFARQYGDALARLADEAKQRADATTELRWVEHLAAHDPLDGAAVARLVGCLAATGDRARALQCALSYEKRMHDELELPPDQAVVDVVAKLRRTSPSPVYAVRAVANENPDATSPEPSFVDASTNSDLNATPTPVASTIAVASTLRSRWSGRWKGTIWSGAVAAALAVGLVFRVAASHLADDRAEAQASTIMIAPFRVNAADPVTADLREGLLDLLSVRLADADTKRAADPTRVLQAWIRAGNAPDSALSVTAASRVARDLGAGEVLIGSVESSGPSVIVNASLVDVSGSRIKASARVVGSPDSLVALADRIVSELILREEGDRTSVIPDRTTNSPFALRAYLAGRAAYRRADYYGAVRSYGQAVTQDPKFALAALGLAIAADRANAAEQHDRGLAIAWERQNDLSPSDRAYLIAFAGPRYPEPSPAAEMLAAWERAVRVTPDRADGWNQLGESFYFDGDLLGMRDAQARAADAFRHALELDPSFAPARRMLALLYARQSDTASLRALQATSLANDSTDAMRVFVRWRSAQALGDVRALEHARREFDAAPNSALRSIAMISQFDGVSIDDGDRAVEILRRRALSDAETIDVELARHSRALNSDDYAGALATTSNMGAAQPSLHPHLRLRVLDALYSNGDRAAASAAAEELNGMVRGPRPASAPDSALRLADVCVIGQWRLATSDTTAARWAVRLLRAAGTTLPRFPIPVGANPATCAELLDVSLAVAERGVGARDRLAHLDSLMLSGPAVGDAMRYANLVVARHYQAIGDPVHAQAALQRRSYMRGWPRYRATGLRLLIEVALETGDSATVRSARARLAATHRRTKIADGSGAFVHRLRSFSHGLVH
jgi:DNA-binding SARP family transcriptional activator/TolB-like protein